MNSPPTPTLILSSHDDEGKTVPNSPKDDSFSVDDDGANGDFARLVPANRAARIAFNEVVDKLRTPDSGWTETGLEKYMHIDRVKVDVHEENSDTDTDGDIPPLTISLWTGYYRLNLDIPPSNGKIGWVVGRGRSDLINRGIDFLLTCSSIYGVSGRHARFLHHSSSNALMVVAGRRPVVLNGTVELENAHQAITAVVTGISFGDLIYRLTFTSLNRNVYAQQLKNLHRSSSGGLPGFMSPTPASTDYELKHYTVKAVFAEGSTCIMSSGIDRRTGALVAIKEMKRNVRNSSALAHEIEVNRSLSPHPRICELKNVIYMDDRSATQLGPNNVDKIYMIYSPLGRSNLQSLVLSEMSVQDRLVIFKQCVDGIAYIHSKHLMHRDIKPGNIIIVSQNPPEARIIDFGQATSEEFSKNHMAGTIRYLAPEVMALKRGQSQIPYTNAVDVWGLGLCGYQLFTYQTYLWQELNEKDYQHIIRRLKRPMGSVDSMFSRISHLLILMLTWDFEQRISAADALISEVLSDLLLDDADMTSITRADSGLSQKRALET